MTSNITESLVESAALSWLSPLGYTDLFGPGIATEEPAAELEGVYSIQTFF